MARTPRSASSGTTGAVSAPATDLWPGLRDKIAQTTFLDRVALTVPLVHDGPTLSDLAEVLHLQSPARSVARLFDFDSAKHDLAHHGVRLRGRLSGSGRCRLELRLRLEKTHPMPIEELGSWRRLHPRTLIVELAAQPHHIEHTIAIWHPIEPPALTAAAHTPRGCAALCSPTQRSLLVRWTGAAPIEIELGTPGPILESELTGSLPRIGRLRLRHQIRPDTTLSRTLSATASPKLAPHIATRIGQWINSCGLAIELARDDAQDA